MLRQMFLSFVSIVNSSVNVGFARLLVLTVTLMTSICPRDELSPRLSFYESPR